jgi:D-glucosaminate-6-phosphate ammonia-lyase
MTSESADGIEVLTYERIGLHRAINAQSNTSVLGSATLSRSVIAAMGAAGTNHVVMADLLRAAGRYVADATGAEDACITTGAAAGIAISVAALVAGDNLACIEQLPNAGEQPNEIILLRGHSVHFGAPIRQMIALGGGKVIEVGSVNKVDPAHVSSAITDRTVGILFVAAPSLAAQRGQLPIEDLAVIGRDYGVPVIVDAAEGDALRRWIPAGADLMIASGGKSIGGPTSGFICGRADLIALCRAQYAGIGRPMKVGKENVMGLVQAIHELKFCASEVEQRSQLERMTRLAAAANRLVGVSAKAEPDEWGRPVVRVMLQIDPVTAGRDAVRLAAELAAGVPPIYVRDFQTRQGLIAIDPRSLPADGDEAILQRLGQILGWKSHSEAGTDAR